MTNQDLYDYIKKNIPEHKKEKDYFADSYVKNGYGQIRGGYFEEAYIRNRKICKPKAEPSQKWHLLVSYYDYKIENSKINMQAQASLGGIMCPQLMIWIAEIVGLNSEILQKAVHKAIEFEEKENTKSSRKIKSNVLAEYLHWGEIVNLIKEKRNFQEVIEAVQRIK